MQEGAPADRADLAIAEEAAERHGTDLLAEQIAVVIPLSEQMRSPAHAGEE
jgi:hypothetical protein